ncbi:hypothetical protein GEMRC1_006361 [Eukaryota sp. GEM-RC1]
MINIVDNGGRLSLADQSGISTYDRLSAFPSESDLLGVLQQHRKNYKKTITKRSKIAPPWTPDEFVVKCQNDCGTSFGLFVRRHHCRSCGKCVCNGCSSNRTPLPSLGFFTPVRVCNSCYKMSE